MSGINLFIESMMNYPAFALNKFKSACVRAAIASSLSGIAYVAFIDACAAESAAFVSDSFCSSIL